MALLYREPSPKDADAPSGPFPNLLSKAIMTRALKRTIVDYNGPLGGWSSTLTGCFDNFPQSFQDSRFIVPKPGHYHISYSIPYQLTPEVAASFDGTTHPGFMLFTGDKTLMHFHPIPSINTPNFKCLISNDTLTFSVTWQLMQGSEVSIFYLSSYKNQNIEKEAVIPVIVAPEPEQCAWWSIIRVHV